MNDPQRRLREDLLDWFDANQRTLPWRGSRDPYRILLSEVMSQQTRILVVVDYFHRFLDRFPNVEALAAAEESEVLALWSGLGYYQRARRLHAAAREVVSRGGFPTSFEGLKSLPGIGDYTAAAVGSIAFDVVEPVLDGNVERVLTRWLRLGGDPKRVAVRRRLRETAATLLDAQRPGDSNQAMMELGATICTPRSPRCGDCPLAESCRAFRDGVPTEYPESKPKNVTKVIEVWIAVVVQRDDRLLLARRSAESEVLAGAWMVPSVRLSSEEFKKGRRARWTWRADGVARNLTRSFGGRWSVDRPVAQVKHGITFRSLEVHCSRARVDRLPRRDDLVWVTPPELEALHTSSLVAKILSAQSSSLDLGAEL
ncbi:MAG: A/G-specific adenine glycosylase [Acidobacteriota bacterium]